LTFEERKSILKWYIKFENVAEVQRQWKREWNVNRAPAIFFHTPHSTQYTQHILPLHSNNFNDVFLLIILQRL
jgi:hypothetical protein